MLSNEIRQSFLNFFKKNGHEIVRSSPLVPQNDPTLMFANSGMVQFKNVFTGLEKRDYTRATTAQKCIRAGGKHNDLENVGYTARHHTFFEMMGNFSFGDYFKENAIPFAWEFITKELGIDKEKLYVTIYHDDEDAYKLWKKLTGFADEKIIRIATSDNFWSMGDTGPCGPCSEIFYDHGEEHWGGPPGSPDEDGDRFIEIWNLVFMQYEQTATERLNLPKPSIDTGMGLERVAALMSGSNDNYKGDLLRYIVEEAANIAGVEPYGEYKFSMRVIADHIRACTFLMADGVLPSNEGRGYVLRRIMRRAMRHVHMIGYKDALMHQLVPLVVAKMGEAYPEIIQAAPLAVEILKMEETKFKQMLDRGLSLLEAETKSLGEGDKLAGEVAFKLYDTYGFPLDLTADVLKGKNLEVDNEGFEKSMAKQREEARKNWAGSGDCANEKIWFDVKEKVGATDFLGYSSDKVEGQITAIVKDGAVAESLKSGDKASIIVNQSPFYGESGGQIGDTGTITTENGDVFEVTDTQRKNDDMFVHIGVMKSGEIKTGDNVALEIDSERRREIRAHHSVAHLLQSALRNVLGLHVSQKGSAVTPDSLRFDFTHPKQVTKEELIKIEDEVNSYIRRNLPVVTQLMTPEMATEQGAIALFGEKYGDEVRVLKMGEGCDMVSIELCGGTHVARTGDIGYFKITSESSIASGVRRVEAKVAGAVHEYIKNMEQVLNSAAEVTKTPIVKVVERINSLMTDNKRLEKEIADLKKKLAMGGGNSGDSAFTPKDISGVKVISSVVNDINPKDLKGMVYDFRKSIGSGIVALIGTFEGKLSIIVGVTDDLTSKYNAADMVKAGAVAAGGSGGGGKADIAQAGGSDTSKANDALSAIETMI